MNSKTYVTFPQLMTLSVFVALFVFIYAFPLSIIVELYSSFGYYNKSRFVNLRLMLLGLVIVVCGFNIVVNYNSWLRLGSVQLYCVFLAYTGVVVLFHLDEFAYARDARVTAAEYFSPLFFKYVAYALIGTHLIHFYKFRALILLFTVVAGATVIQFTDFDILRIDVNSYIESANRGNYQFMGDAMSVSALVLVALSRSVWLRGAILVLGSIVIFLIGSRTSFAVFFVTSVIFIGWVGSFRWVVPGAIIVFSSLFFYGNKVVDWDAVAESNPRMVKIFTEYEDDNSIIGRKERDEHGWQDISENIVLGKFGGQRELLGGAASWASYMHNVVSYWRQFGLLPFILLALMSAHFALLCSRRRVELPHVYSVPFLLGVFLIIESVISRSFAFTHIHIFFGVYIAFHACRRYNFDPYMVSSPVQKRRRRRRRISSAASQPLN